MPFGEPAAILRLQLIGDKLSKVVTVVCTVFSLLFFFENATPYLVEAFYGIDFLFLRRSANPQKVNPFFYISLNIKPMAGFRFISCLFAAFFIAPGISFAQPKTVKTAAIPAGSVEFFRPEMRKLFSEKARVEVIAKGFKWAEGPVWVADKQMLLFSDVPNNKIYKWTAKGGQSLYLQPSGYTGKIPRGGELGSNGLALTNDGRLLLCQDGNRVLAVMGAPIASPKPNFKVLAQGYKGKRFDSPNDLAVAHNGDIYFTDPPYGLVPGIPKDAPYQGVYKVSKNGTVTLLTDSISRPNGIALFPNGRSLIIANSDTLKPFWYKYDINKNGLLTNGRVFYDGRKEFKKEPRSSDGVKIDPNGNVYATGPGGVWVFNSNGVPIGRIKINVDTSNCEIAYNTKELFITAGNYVLKIKML